MSQEQSPATLGEANWQRLVKRLRDMRAYGGRDYECMDDAADMIVQMADHIALLVAATSARSETPRITDERFADVIKFLKYWHGHADFWSFVNEQLRIIAKEAACTPPAIRRSFEQECADTPLMRDVMAERDRYRVALSTIKIMKPEEIADGFVHGPLLLFRNCQRIAKDALKDKS